MNSDDYLRDKAEESILDRTKRRRAGRWRRKRYVLLVAVLILALLVLAIPSFVSHSSMGRSLLASTLSGYGLDADAESVRIGWITPLRVTGLEIHGQKAGSNISVEQLNGQTTVLDVLAGNTSDLGDITLRGVKVRCSMTEGRCSLEPDLAALMEPSESESPTTGTIQIQDIHVAIEDKVSDSTWNLTQTNSDIQLTEDSISLSFSGVIVGPHEDSGSLKGSAFLANDSSAQDQWHLDLETESLPLSLVSLVRRRFPEATSSLPDQFGGDASGLIKLVGAADGSIHSSVQAFEIRNLVAADQNSPRVWKNSRASLNGDLSILNDRVVGNGLTATTDFASATLNGAFASSMTLVGADNNPLKWLDALDGTASAEVDLAAFQKALPGLLPIKQEAQILSGRAIANVQSAAGQVAKSKLTIRSDTLRFRARGRAVVIEPIQLDAVVSNANGSIKAEEFKLNSSFASAVGKGTMRGGDANFDVDFGRLSSMLRPLIDLSDIRLGGSANGNVKWNASGDNVWRLDGGGNANNLLVSLPGGKELRRSSLRATVAAVGRWSGDALQELSTASMSVNSAGLDLRVDLTQPISDPSPTRQLPVRLAGNGQLETLLEVIGPWVPSDIRHAKGGFDIVASADVSTVSGRVTDVTVNLINPRIAYQEYLVSQRAIKFEFDGQYSWPSGDLNSRSTNVFSDALNVEASGDVTAEATDLKVVWDANLSRLQSGLQTQAIGNVRAPAQPLIGSWTLSGDCSGTFFVSSEGQQIEIQSETKGKNIAIRELVAAKPFAFVAGQNQNQIFGSQSTSQEIWSEPSLQITGLIVYDTQTAGVVADQMQISTDWLATTLSGNIEFGTSSVSLHGPARIKMPDVARRLTSLSGTSINLSGVQETELTIKATQPANQPFAFQVATSLGWDRGSIAGVDFGPTVLPIKVNENTVVVESAMIPVGQGELNLAGEVFYNASPMWIQIRPGLVANNVQMTSEMTDGWLKYLAPLAADATQVDGTLSVELDEAAIVIDDPAQSRIRGRLGIAGAEMRTGRLAAQIVSGIDQLKAIADMRANAFGAAQPRTQDAKKLISMPAQNVEFTFANGVAKHQRLFFQVDRAQVITSGTVNINGPLNVVAQVPLDAQWLGNDLKDLAGQSVALPITGTLDQPRLDSRGIQDVLRQLGTQAIQQKADSYLEQQLNKGIDKIFGR